MVSYLREYFGDYIVFENRSTLQLVLSVLQGGTDCEEGDSMGNSE